MIVVFLFLLFFSVFFQREKEPLMVPFFVLVIKQFSLSKGEVYLLWALILTQ